MQFNVNMTRLLTVINNGELGLQTFKKKSRAVVKGVTDTETILSI